MKKPLEERVGELEQKFANLERAVEIMLGPRPPLSLESQHWIKQAARAKAKEA
jgi:hypothetical protein